MTRPTVAVSTTVSCSVSSPTSPVPLPSPTAVPTSGSAATSFASVGLSPLPPKLPALMTRSPRNDWVTVLSTDALSDAANTVNSVTTPTPTMSADAVPDVRRGLRMAFWRASAAGDAAQPLQRGAEDAADRPRHDRTEHDDARRS